jgi:hypothetical protein
MEEATIPTLMPTSHIQVPGRGQEIQEIQLGVISQMKTVAATTILPQARMIWLSNFSRTMPPLILIETISP